jgi:DNA-binding GntR family transcriptional regulator
MSGKASRPADAPVSGAQLVVSGVKDALETGEMVSGQRLIEADLCLRFGVGRTQVREALHRLATENIVELSPNRGAAIRRMSAAQAADAIAVIELLIGLTARLAARNSGRRGAGAAIRRAVAELKRERRGADGRQVLRARRNVYQAFLLAAGNEELARILNSMQYFMLQGQILLPTLHEAMNDDLEAIAEAILAGSEDLAETLARTHVRRMGSE